MSEPVDKDKEFDEVTQTVYTQLLERLGEGEPQLRLTPTRRVAELLGDPQNSYPIIHVAGTNGKTSTCRLIESILRAYGLRTGMFTSPHIEQFNERIVIDGQPINGDALAENWADIKPYLEMVDAQLVTAGEQRLTFFEASTILALACFADAPVDVAIIEVGLGGEWDSTNIVDARLAVFTAISLDHIDRLGLTVAEIARTKSGIIKPAQTVVSARQSESALVELRRAAELTESQIVVQGEDFDVLQSTVAIGGQLLNVRGMVGNYEDMFLPLFGDHQAQNAVVAIAAVESFFGSQQLVPAVLKEGLDGVTTPGRLQVIGTAPSVIIDAAHNPAGAESLAISVSRFFDFDDVVVVFGVLDDKDAAGIISPLRHIGTRWHVTESASNRARDYIELADIVEEITDAQVLAFASVRSALENAREWASQAPRRAVLVTGSITLIGEALGIAAADDWRIQ
jgi:dihydrofolate synthase/folylpolyglutamate synthase